MDWKPIETAPEATSVLLCDADGDVMVGIKWGEGWSPLVGRAIVSADTAPGVFELVEDYEPTHWAAIGLPQ